MERLARTIRRRVRLARRVERFVQLVVAGGIALVAGLWTATLTTPQSPGWLLGSALALLGLVGLAVGIWSEIDW